MRTLLIILTAVEIALVVVVLAVYLVKIAQSLRAIAGYLGKVNFGVRAIESQCAPIGPSVTRINQQLTTIAQALGGVAGLAEQLGEPETSGRGTRRKASTGRKGRTHG